ncbi:MAG: 4a-hydroxytetrahydrobiopterin dehydratase [Myxococcales bacterium]|nr:4a-hydroxytetrahydrobiopterin dehydratase [Myxococcales bacterium]
MARSRASRSRACCSTRSCAPSTTGASSAVSRPPALDEDGIERALRELPSWRIERGRLHREFRFRDFVEAFGFMTSAALVAERMDHHPEWSNVWATVRVDLVTHDAGAVTELDVALARAMDTIAEGTAAEER